MIARIKEWLKRTLWEEDLGYSAKWRAVGIGSARVIVHGVKSFSTNLVGMQASGLTMVTLLALVPMLWLGLGVAETLGFEETLQAKLEELKKTQKPFESIIANFQGAVDRVSFKALGLLGTVILTYSGYSLLSKVEQSFNHVWKAKHRSWYTRLGSFVGVVVIVPLFLLVAIVADSFLEAGTLVKHMRDHIAWLASLYDAGVRFLPSVIVWIALTLLYKLMPSAKVRWSASAIAGGVAAVGLVGLHGTYVKAQVGIALNNQVYAALAAVPMLIVYLSLVWTVILAGVQVSFAVQHVNDLGPPKEIPSAVHGSHRRLALVLAHAACERSPLELSEFTQSIDVPRAWVDGVVEDLEDARILEIVDEGYVIPARSASLISMWDVVKAVEGHEGDVGLELPADLEARLSESLEAVRETLDEVELISSKPRDLPRVD